MRNAIRLSTGKTCAEKQFATRYHNMSTSEHAAPNPPCHQRCFFRIAAIYALLAVILGAFGAHALHDRLVSHGSLRTWETAVDYQFWHALALLAWVLFNPSPQSRPITPIAFSIGNLLFSGSLYFLALGGPSWLGPITPLGGLSFMIGWGYWLISGPSTRLNTNEK